MGDGTVGGSVNGCIGADGFQAGFDRLEESAGLGTVVDPMVEGYAEVHNRPNGNGVIPNYRPLLNSFGGQNGRLRVVYYGLGDDRAQGAGVVQGESTSVDVIQSELVLPRR